MDNVKPEFGDFTVAAAIYNVAAKFVRKPFLEQSEEEFMSSLEPTIKGAFNFEKQTLPLITLDFTGATDAVAFIGTLRVQGEVLHNLSAVTGHAVPFRITSAQAVD